MLDVTIIGGTALVTVPASGWEPTITLPSDTVTAVDPKPTKWIPLGGTEWMPPGGGATDAKGLVGVPAHYATDRLRVGDQLRVRRPFGAEYTHEGEFLYAEDWETQDFVVVGVPPPSSLSARTLLRPVARNGAMGSVCVESAWFIYASGLVIVTQPDDEWYVDPATIHDPEQRVTCETDW